MFRGLGFRVFGSLGFIEGLGFGAVTDSQVGNGGMIWVSRFGSFLVYFGHKDLRVIG